MVNPDSSCGVQSASLVLLWNATKEIRREEKSRGVLFIGVKDAATHSTRPQNTDQPQQSRQLIKLYKHETRKVGTVGASRAPTNRGQAARLMLGIPRILSQHGSIHHQFAS